AGIEPAMLSQRVMSPFSSHYCNLQRLYIYINFIYLKVNIFSKKLSLIDEVFFNSENWKAKDKSPNSSFSA
ncbi:MAG: hypothetical protein IKL15_02280, partial [Mycoplasmataceae bacterium]|nr:hypothetical protein [Mycoplasmataceae bacterium]